MTARDVANARRLLAEYLAARGSGDCPYSGAHEDSDAFLFTFGLDERLVSYGGGVALVDKQTGAVSLLGSAEQLERRGRITPVSDDDAPTVTECFVPPRPHVLRDADGVRMSMYARRLIDAAVHALEAVPAPDVAEALEHGIALLEAGDEAGVAYLEATLAE